MIHQTSRKQTISTLSNIKVLLADDHSVVREGLRSLLDAERDIIVVGEAKTGREALQMALDLQPDIMLMDIAMPLLNGMEATRQMQVAAPHIKVVALSAHNDDVYVEQMVAVGARGYLVKQTSFKIVAEAIRSVHQGKFYFSQSINSKFNNEDWKFPSPGASPLRKSLALSSREAEVLQLIAEGSANKQIASHLEISIKTVEKHRQHLMSKLNIHDTAGLTRYAIGAGIIESSVHLAAI